jgi:predicted CoA-binding protein
VNNIKPGDIVTLKGLSKQNEKPLGIVKKKLDKKTYEIFWINEGIATRFALVDMAKSHRLEIVSEADQLLT